MLIKTAKQYKSYLNSAAWKRLAREMKERAGWACQACDKGDTKLDPHHRSYRNIGFPEEASDIIVLCSYCHSLLENGRVNGK